MMDLGCSCHRLDHASPNLRAAIRRAASGGQPPEALPECYREASSHDVFCLFLQKQKRGAELHMYLEEGTYYRGCLEGLALMI